MVENKYLVLDEETVMIAWHLMFYVSSTVLLIATSSLSKVVNISKPSTINNKVVLYSIISVFVVFAILISTPYIDKNITPIFEHTIWDRMGIAHFIAFTYAAIVSRYLFIIKSKFKGSLGSVAMPLFIAMMLMTLMHFIELLSEIWKVVPLGETGELLEEILWIPTYFSMAIGAWKLKKSLG